MLLPFLPVLPFAFAVILAVIASPASKTIKLLVLLIPLEAFATIEIGFSIPPAYLVLLMILVGIVLRGELLSTRVPGGKAIVIFLVIGLLATLIAMAVKELPSVQLHEAMRFRAGALRSPLQLALLAFHFSIFFLVVNYVRQRKDADSLLKLSLWTGFALVLVGIYQVTAFTLNLPLKDCTWSVNLIPDSMFNTSYGKVRLYSALITNFSPRATFAESLHFAHYLNSVVPIVLALWMSGSKEVRDRFGFLASPVASLLGVVILLFTMSRSGWGGLIVALIVLMFWLSKRRLVARIPLIVAVLALVVAGFARFGFFSIGVSNLWAVIVGRIDMVAIALGPRIESLAILWESFKQNPILGLGAGNFSLLGSAAQNLSMLHTSSGLLWAALADFGLLGFIALNVVFLGVLLRLRRAIKVCKESTDRVVMIGLFAALAGTMFQSLFVSDRPPFFLLFLLGLATVYSSITLAQSGKPTVCLKKESLP